MVNYIAKRSNLFEFESKTLLDEELDNGILPENKLNKATVVIFMILELIVLGGFFLHSYSMLQMLFLSSMALLVARQIALDFTYHVFLDIYTLPMAMGAMLAPALLFKNGNMLESIIYGLGFSLLLLSISLVCSWVKKQPAGIGGGDIKFAFVMGGFLPGMILTVCVFMSSVISLFVTTLYEDKTNVPFGPGLLLSFWICLIFKIEILTFLFKALG